MLEVVEPINFKEEFYHLKVENPSYHDFVMFSTPNDGKGFKLGAQSGVVGNPIPTFLIAIHRSKFDISNHFPFIKYTRKKTQFSTEGSKSCDTAKLLHQIKL